MEPSATAPLVVEHSENERRGAFFVTRNGARSAAMTYKRTEGSSITIDHTEVSDALRGQGVSRQLLDALVAWARRTGTRVRATCPYARAQFEKDPSIQDVYLTP